jgi:perosamine synthetase
MIVPRNIIYSMRFMPDFRSGSSDLDGRFRDGLAALLGGDRNIVPLGRARAGIYLLVRSVVRGACRKIVLSPYTIPDVINLVRLGGGVPVFVDFLPRSTNIDVDHLAELVAADVAAVIVTHYHVIQKDMDAVADLCRRRGVALFDDCAIALGASYRGRPVGTLTDASVFSFSGFKVLNYYWGGALSMPPGDAADVLDREVSSWARMPTRLYLPQIRKVVAYAAATGPLLFPFVFRLRRRVINAGEIADVFPVSRIETTELDDTIRSRPSYSALREWVRKFGCVQKLVEHRRAIATIYDRHFQEISVSADAPEAVRRESGFVNYPIVVGEDRRDAIYKAALGMNFDIGLSLYPNAHETPSFRGLEGRTSNVTKLVRTIVSLPTHSRVTEEHAKQLVTFLAAAMKPC